MNSDLMSLEELSPESHPLADPGELLLAFRVLLASEGRRLPMLPDIATRMLELSNRPQVEISHVVAEVQKDGTVTGRLLAIANSPFYTRAMPCTSVHAAVVRMGLRETRDVIFRIVSASEIFRVPHFSEAARGIRQHSVVAGYAAREVCRLSGVDPELAFLSGLLHDVGKIGLLIAAGGWIDPLPTMADLAAPLSLDHAEAGALACEYWKLPQPVAEAVRAHHAPSADNPLSVVAALSDRLCHHAGVGGPPKEVSEADLHLVRMAGLKEEHLPQIQAVVAEAAAATSSDD